MCHTVKPCELVYYHEKKKKRVLNGERDCHAQSVRLGSPASSTQHLRDIVVLLFEAFSTNEAALEMTGLRYDRTI